MDRHDTPHPEPLADRLRRCADVPPPPGLEQSLMAAFERRRRAPRRRPWPLPLAMAASVLAATLLLRSLLAPTPGNEALAGPWAGSAAPDEELRRVDRALELARAQAADGDGDQAHEAALWLAREQATRRSGPPTAGEALASHDPLAL